VKKYSITEGSYFETYQKDNLPDGRDYFCVFSGELQ
jgi:hypothetical protein